MLVAVSAWIPTFCISLTALTILPTLSTLTAFALNLGPHQCAEPTEAEGVARASLAGQRLPKLVNHMIYLNSVQ